MTINPFDKFSSHAKAAIRHAFEATLAGGEKIVTPGHILFGLAQESGSIAHEILTKAKLTTTHIRQELLPATSATPTNTVLTVNHGCRKILEKALVLASTHQHYYVGTEHLLAALLDLDDQHIKNLFTKQQISLTNVRRQTTTALKSSGKFRDFAQAMNTAANESETHTETPEREQQQTSALDYFATELTNPSLQHQLDPVIGRDLEIERLIEILSRRRKNNPLLLGDPGVGKTAIVEGLAKRIANGNVPPLLADKKIYALDLGSIIAGTSFRGEFEQRLKQIINEIKRDTNIIVFIDEIHAITGAGSAAGSLDAATLLKPALARGEIRCIGATTFEEYKKSIEPDAALERRFQPITVAQPSSDETLRILHGLKTHYEQFHGVIITDAALAAATQLSERYITDRFLPDKAIDLLDEAAAALSIRRHISNEVKDIRKMEQRLAKIRIKKTEKVQQEDFRIAFRYKTQEEALQIKITEARQHRLTNQTEVLPEVTAEHIRHVVARITGVPVTQIQASDSAALLKLETTLSKKVIGQPKAISAIATAIRRSRAGLSTGRRPLGSFIFLGPSGVGKTALAQAVAETIFGSSQALIRIDMSEFAEGFTISKLIGAPAGYVGYKEGAKLTDAVKRRPYSVVLFDEIEKGHPQVFNLLLQLLDEGYVTDAAGKKINFTNTVVIMTSNIGSQAFTQQAGLGFQADTAQEKNALKQRFADISHTVTKQLQDHFRPEFLNRIDSTIIFEPLDLTTVAAIAAKQLNELRERLQQQHITLRYKITPVSTYIATSSYSPDQGARGIARYITEQIENPIAQLILEQQSKIISIQVGKQGLTIRPHGHG